MKCTLAGICSGCDWIEVDPIEQDRRKLDLLLELAHSSTENVTLHAPQKWELRDRVDLTIVRQDNKMVIGLASTDRSQIVDWATCPMLSPRLLEAFIEFRKNLPPINKGSVRLRVSPTGVWGVWLDFAHTDVQMLFEEKAWLKGVSDKFYVEVGQKRKKLEWIDDQPKLNKTSHSIWFATQARSHKIPLQSQVASFTQPSHLMNTVLIERVLSLVDQSQLKSWVELGAGIGNFTLALSANGCSVDAIENDPWSLESLQLNIAAAERSELSREGTIEVHRVDFQNHPERLQKLFHEPKGLLVDPPRSGLREFTQTLHSMQQLPEAIVYVSCYPESFKVDLDELEKLGFKMVSLEGVDQFAQSHHLETVALLKLNKI